MGAPSSEAGVILKDAPGGGCRPAVCTRPGEALSPSKETSMSTLRLSARVLEGQVDGQAPHPRIAGSAGRGSEAKPDPVDRDARGRSSPFVGVLPDARRHALVTSRTSDGNGTRQAGNPVTTQLFLHRVAARRGCRRTILTGWRWANPVLLRRGPRPDGVPRCGDAGVAGRLVRCPGRASGLGLPSWASGPAALVGPGGEGGAGVGGWARPSGGPVAFEQKTLLEPISVPPMNAWVTGLPPLLPFFLRLAAWSFFSGMTALMRRCRRWAR